ncbi:MAG TPA: serine/threonine-protein kinase [Kofleriaceae bacterium]|nr:serine/threonine-protein kinase [Kofleriaceae bacterium]
MQGDSTDDDRAVRETDRAAIATQLAPGTLVGRYRIEARIGQGGMGVVYRARDTELDRPVALKLVRSHGAAEQLTERLRRESRLQARAAHRSVITVYDIGRDGDQVYVAMELIDGVTLGGWLAARPRSWRAIVDVFREAAEGLAAAHAAGLVHRDFKPDNVLVEQRGDRVARVLVTDFGVARALESPDLASDSQPREVDLTATGMMLGTPAYMAPEQLDGDPIDERCDVFSFSVALWEALFGARPFPGDSIAEIVAAFAGPPRLPQARTGRDLPPRWLVGVLRRGLAIDRDARIASIAALSAAIDWRHRRRTHQLAVALAAVVVAGGLGAIAYARGASAPPSVCETPPPLRDELPALGERIAATAGSPEIAAYWRQTTQRYAEQTMQLRGVACAAPRSPWLEDVVRCIDRSAAQQLAIVDGVVREPSAERRADILRELYLAAPRECVSPAAPSLLALASSDPRVTTARLALLEAEGAWERDPDDGRVALDRARLLIADAGFPPLRHELALLEAILGFGDPKAPLEFRTVAQAAERDGHVLTAARAWVASLTGLETDRDLFAFADSALLRAGDPPRTRAQWHAARAGMLVVAKRRQEAASELARVYASLDAIAAPLDPWLAHMIANVEIRAGDYARAATLLSRALAFARATGVVRGAALLQLENDHAFVIGELGHGAESRRTLEALLAGVDPTKRLPEPDLVRTIRLLASERLFAGEYEQALAILERWRPAIDATLDRDSLHRAHLAHIEAQVLAQLERFGEAERAARRALELRVAILGASNGNTAETRILLGRILLQLDQRLAAKEQLERGITDLAAFAGEDFPLVAQARYTLAALLLELHEPDAARPIAERALAVYETSSVLSAEERGSVQWTLAETLPDSDPRVRRLVEGALAAWAVDPASYRAEIAAARARLRRLHG